MKPNKYIAVSLGFLSMGLTSCNDFLDQNPEEWVEVNSSVTSVQQAAAASYCETSYAWLAELSSDNVIDQNAPNYPASSQSRQILTHHNYTSDRVYDQLFRFEQATEGTAQDTPYHFWTQTYYSVAQCNNVLQAIEDLRNSGRTFTEAEQRTLDVSEGECLLNRAYDHFVLVNMFSQAYKDSTRSLQDAGVPYVTVPDTKPNSHYERGTVTEDYVKIEADLVRGLQLIGNNTVSSTAPKYHWNHNSACAFAARFYLFKRDYDKVISYANEVLGTDETSELNMMMKYGTQFDGITNSVEFAQAFQDPDDNNNLLLLTTYCNYDRRAAGYRYAMNGLAARAIFYHNSPLWRSWAIMPTAGIMTFGSSERGYFFGKMCERFQMTDQIAQTGYVHTIMREFTGSELMLERAEAKIMKDDLDGAFDDLATYYKSFVSFSPTNLASWFNSNPQLLTKAIISSWFRQGGTDDVPFRANWTFTQNMSPSYVVPADATNYMNCLEYFRRFETCCTGRRFFDLKRWGAEWSHTYGLESTTVTLAWNDPRRAMEVPYTVGQAGLELSRPQSTDSVSLAVTNKSDYVYKAN